MVLFVRALLFATAAIGSPLLAASEQPVRTITAVKMATPSSFVPSTFDPPTLVKTPAFKLLPLAPDLVKIDYDAYMSSIDHLQRSFTRSTDWPREDISQADAMQDMEAEQARFQTRKSFAYAVLTPDGSRERGSVYVSPSPVNGYDAVVRMWVTKAEYDVGFDAVLYKWVTAWMRADWPFRKVAYPGRSINWRAWDSALASSALKKGIRPAHSAP